MYTYTSTLNQDTILIILKLYVHKFCLQSFLNLPEPHEIRRLSGVSERLSLSASLSDGESTVKYSIIIYSALFLLWRAEKV